MGLQSYEFYKTLAEIQNSHERRGRSFGLNITQLHQFFFEPIELKRDTGRDPNANDSHAIKLQGIEEAVDDHRMHGYKRYRTKEDLEREFKDFSFSRDYRGGFECGYTHDAPIINTDKAMAYLMALGKGLLEIFDANAVVNATGLGAKDLLGDEDVYPVRGAILRVDNTRNGQFNHLNDAYLVPAQKDNNGVPTGVVFIVPRNDDILYVGSIIQPHNDQANVEPGSPEVCVMWDRAAEFMPSLRHAEFVHHYPFAQGLRPFTKKNVKVRADTQAGFPLVHNYGHGGSGWTLGFGTARCAVYILKALLEEDYGEADEKWNQKAETINEKIYGKQD
ncbi:D-amino-acid oxidase 2 [Aspergillus udagawae]|nr:D-amino-acid oxidase 2 [Aspergillus udagawae]